MHCVVGSVTIGAPRLFDEPPALPEGMRYDAALLDAAEQAALAGHLAQVPFRAFAFHGFEGRRRTHSYGWRYVSDPRLAAAATGQGGAVGRSRP
jgi:hypothetical protein